VIISEACSDQGDTLPQIIARMCDLIEKRSEEGKNFGTVLIPEGLLSQLAHYRSLINELNQAFGDCKTEKDIDDKNNWLLTDGEYLRGVLTSFSASVFEVCPEFFKKQLLIER